tara:strand:+ start:24335 stop:24469 length:135 start_codon:yes stop_codon:yes gene_type:complete
MSELLNKEEMLSLNDNPFEDKELNEKLETPIANLDDIPAEQIID